MKTPDQKNEFASAIEKLSEEHYANRLAMAKKLQPILNAYIRSHRPETIEQYRDLSIQIEDSLRLLQLGIKSPKSGKPGTLTTVESSDGKPRFRLRVQGDSSSYWSELPELELMPDLPRREGMAEKLKASRENLSRPR